MSYNGAPKVISYNGFGPSTTEEEREIKTQLTQSSLEVNSKGSQSSGQTVSRTRSIRDT